MNKVEFKIKSIKQDKKQHYNEKDTIYKEDLTVISLETPISKVAKYKFIFKTKSIKVLGVLKKTQLFRKVSIPLHPCLMVNTKT